MNFHYTKEKCGVVGVWTIEKDAPYLARRGIVSLQHRGQEGAGLSVLTPKKMTLLPIKAWDSSLTY